jgi:pyruvate,water dikinase
MAEPNPPKKTLRERWQKAFGWLGRGRARADAGALRADRFRRMYLRFREILSLNDSLLQLFADIEDKLLGNRPFALSPIVQRVRRGVMDVFVMARDLNQIGDNRFRDLYDVLRRVTADLDLECEDHRRVHLGPLIVPLAELRACDAPLAGGKMANLGEVLGEVKLRVPEGFAITAAAFDRFMSRNYLLDRAAQLEGILDMFGPRTLAEACRDLQQAIRSAELPLDLENAIQGAYDTLTGGQPILVCMRSSALGEDSESSHAGLYYTELNVSRDLLLDTYSMIVASAFGPGAVSYRMKRGLTDWEGTMAVGCMRMLEPRCSGIMFSRGFHHPKADRVVISVTAGVSARVAAGKQGAEEITVTPGRLQGISSAFLSSRDLARLVDAARRLESHFGRPQDIEWAIDPSGELYILQARPMVVAPTAPRRHFRIEPEGGAPILRGGHTACPGVGAGPVFVVRGDDDIERFPPGSVLVARHSSSAYARLMTSCQAIVTDVGSPTGHMAILTREFRVPAIVGLEDATQLLATGRVVTVNASTCQVYEGEIPTPPAQKVLAPLANSPAVKRLRSLSRFVTPLNLVDPHLPGFRADHCQTLHDLSRFIHEKVYHVMFRIGDMAANSGTGALTIDVNLPLAIHVFDLGGGLCQGAGTAGRIKPGDILSVPLLSFLDGLLDPRIVWNRPRPVSARGFLSVLGQGIAGPPPEALGMGNASFAVISDRYMNFSSKAGYHFSTVDVYCGQSQNKNYIHFRFAGGGAGEDRRLRRVHFLAEVLDRLDFRIQLRSDHLVARLEKYERDFIQTRLTDLGRLTLCSRQLDMLMDSDNSPHYFAQMFLEGKLESF